MAFLSSRIEETESKLLSAAGMRVEFGEIMEVGRSGFNTMMVNRCAFIGLKGSDGFLQCKRHYIQYIAVGRLSS